MFKRLFGRKEKEDLEQKEIDTEVQLAEEQVPDVIPEASETVVVQEEQGTIAALPEEIQPEPPAVPEEPKPAEQGGNPFTFGLTKTRKMFERIADAFREPTIEETLWEDLEEALISADAGVVTTEWLIETLRERVNLEGLKTSKQVETALHEELRGLLGDPVPLNLDKGNMSIILVIGVNGVGKTTTIAKLANYLQKNNHRVLLAAGDTFRAAAIDQLKLWGERIHVPVVSHELGADPAAVAFDALSSASARGCDVLIVDTAGRLHTKYNLMEELKKINKVLGKQDTSAPQETLLVVDATTGQNAVLQAQQFAHDIGVTGLVLTKLDGTAKGGVVFSIADELDIPLKFVGTGEQIENFAPFNPDEFIQALVPDIVS